jgi:hypothetical protein
MIANFELLAFNMLNITIMATVSKSSDNKTSGRSLFRMLLHLVLQNLKIHVRFEVFTAVTMKNAVFWDVTPCGSSNNRRFGGA